MSAVPNAVGDTVPRSHLGVWRTLALVRLKMANHRVRIAIRRHRWRTIAQLVTILPALTALGAAVSAAAYLTSQESIASSSPWATLATLFAVVSLGGFVACTPAALQALYLASDLPFLFSLPIPHRVLFAGKLLDTMVGMAPFGVVTLSFVGGYGLARGASLAFFAMGMLVCVALLIAVASLAMLVVGGVARIVPARRARTILMFTSLAVVATAWSAWVAVSPVTTSAENALASPSHELQLSVDAAGNRLAWTPLGWAARALTATADSQTTAAMGYGAGFLMVAGVVTALSYTLFATTYARGFVSMRAASDVTPQSHRPVVAVLARALTSPLPLPMGPLVIKEWLTMLRDFHRLSGAVWPLSMVGINTIVLSRGKNQAPVGAPEIDYWLNAGSAALLPWGASHGIVLCSFGTERRAFHLFRSLPLSVWSLLCAKIYASFVPVVLASGCATLIISLAHGATYVQLLGMLAIVCWGSAGYVIIDTCAAAVAPNFAAEHVQRSTMFVGRAMSFITGAVFTVTSGIAISRIVLFATGVPTALRGVTGVRIAGIAPLGWLLVVIMTAIALLTLVLALLLAENRLRIIVRDGG